MIGFIKEARRKKIEHEAVVDNFMQTCERLTDKTISLKNKLSNGGGAAIVAAMTSLIQTPDGG